MPTTDTYPVPMEQEQLATSMGFFKPAAPPTDAQRMEAAQIVEGVTLFKRTLYWMHLQDIVARDLPKHSQICGVCWLLYNKQRQLRKPTRKPKKHHRWHCDTSRDIIPIY